VLYINAEVGSIRFTLSEPVLNVVGEKLMNSPQVDWISQLLTGHCKGVRGAKKPTRISITNKIEGGEIAWEILGEDYVSPEEVSKAHGFNYSEEQKTILALTMPNFRMLKWLERYGYMLVATLPIKSCLSLFRLICNQPYYRSREGWCTRPPQSFFREETLRAAAWLMIRKQPYMGSSNKTWAFQQDFLTRGEYIPNAIEVTYAFTTYHRVRGVCLLYGVYVRTSSVDENGQHVIVGNNNAEGINVCEFRNEEHVNYVGVLTARIPA